MSLVMNTVCRFLINMLISLTNALAVRGRLTLKDDERFRTEPFHEHKNQNAMKAIPLESQLYSYESQKCSNECQTCPNESQSYKYQCYTNAKIIEMNKTLNLNTEFAELYEATCLQSLLYKPGVLMSDDEKTIDVTRKSENFKDMFTSSYKQENKTVSVVDNKLKVFCIVCTAVILCCKLITPIESLILIALKIVLLYIMVNIMQ